MSSDRPVYEEIGRWYSTTRREDPRIAAEIHSSLGPAGSLVNVGAGTGNYEPLDRTVVAAEPSAEMLAQRGVDRTRHVVRAVAESLPFPDGLFDVGLAVLTIHHWTDPEAGLHELRRVARRQVVFYFEPLHTHDFWALAYFPEATDLPSEHDAPGEGVIRQALDVTEIRPVLVPPDCLDGFGAAFWCRPEAYLDPKVQAGMS
jgi:SAM-dependent methyltransferase